MKNKIWLFAVITMISCVHTQEEERLPFYNTPDFTPLFLTDEQIIKDSITHTIDNFSFLNQDGKNITEKTIEGKIHIANFIFTSCGSICPKMTANLIPVSKSYEQDSDVVFLSYSVTPWIDSIAQLKFYKNDYEIHNPNWHFLTGNQKDIYHLARTAYFAEENLGFTKDSTEFLHTEHTILVDRQKRIRGIYNGTLKTDMIQLIEDIRVLQKEE